MKNLVIKNIKLEDKPKIDSLIQVLNAREQLEYSLTDEWFQHVLKTMGEGIFGAYYDSRLIGMATCIQNPEDFQSATVNVVVNPDFRNMRVGTQLYNEVKRYIDNKGIINLQASVKERINGAYVFAKGRGFKSVLYSWQLEFNLDKFDFTKSDEGRNYIVRKADASDGLVYAQLIKEGFGEEISSKALSSILDDPSIFVYVLEVESKPQGVAAVQIRSNAKTGYIFDVAITSQQRGQGLGSLLIKCCLGEIKSVGVGKAMLQVAGKNESALKLYSRLGFKQVDKDIIMSAQFQIPDLTLSDL
ncbi:ribosomal protein S18 acetylase RimI-like enzyme [Desulfitispora alkaliphila]|uniref:GNAT family N-acetyltransferase n=1 Tax=Desulfitispora alkaliphila TaxID=622674 RepID=UPI003D1D4F68